MRASGDLGVGSGRCPVGIGGELLSSLCRGLGIGKRTGGGVARRNCVVGPARRLLSSFEVG